MMTKKQLKIRIGASLKAIEASVTTLRALAFRDIKSAKSTTKVGKLTERRVQHIVLMTDKLELLQEHLRDLSTIRREEIDADIVFKADEKAKRDEVKRVKADEKQRCAEQVKGLSKADVALAKKHGLLGRINGVVQGPAFYTNAEVRARLKQVKAFPKQAKADKKALKKRTSNPVAAFPFPGGPKDKGAKKAAKIEAKRESQIGKFPIPAGKTTKIKVLDASTAHEIKPKQVSVKGVKKAKKELNEQAKIEARLKVLKDRKVWLDQHAVFDGRRKYNRVKSEMNKLQKRLADIKATKPKKGYTSTDTGRIPSKVDHDKMANTLDTGSAIGIMAARPSSHDLPMGTLQSDGGAY